MSDISKAIQSAIQIYTEPYREVKVPIGYIEADSQTVDPTDAILCLVDSPSGERRWISTQEAIQEGFEHTIKDCLDAASVFAHPVGGMAGSILWTMAFMMGGGRIAKPDVKYVKVMRA